MINKERSVLTLGIISSLLLSSTLFSGLLPVASFATPSSSCPELPTDGRPQPKKGANTDSKTWKAVPMRDDPSLFKVVDSAGINIADRFHSKTNAEQYIAHFVCVTSPTPSPTPTPAPSPTPTPPLPAESTPDMPDYGAGGPPAPPEKDLLPRKCINYDLFIDRHIGAQTCAHVVEYPSTSPTYPSKVVAYVEQWVEGRQVYDNVIPKPRDPDVPCTPPRPGIPCKVKVPTPSGPGGVVAPVGEQVFHDIIGDYKIRIVLILDAKQHRLDLIHCEDPPEGPYKVGACQAIGVAGYKEPKMNLFTWP